MHLKLKLLNSIYVKSLENKFSSFQKALKYSRETQNEILKNIIFNNIETIFSKENNLPSMLTCKKQNLIDEFRKTIPISIYDDLEKYVKLIMDGHNRVLTKEKVIIFEKSSGSTSSSKYIPYTKSLFNEIHRGTATWIYDLYNTNPSLKNTKAYWSISPKMGTSEKTKSGINVGFNDDSEYFGPLERFFIRRILAVDPAVSATRDIESCRFITAKELLEQSDLGLISVWSPTFIIILLEYIENNIVELLKVIKVNAKRKKLIENSISINISKVGEKEKQKLDFLKLWPKLEIVSCWTSASSAIFLEQLKQNLNGVKIQGKGLFLTEGIVTIPISEYLAPILAINSHFYEFLPEDYQEENNFINKNKNTNTSTNINTFLPHELIVGKKYIPVITTGGGFYRYNTNDIVQVEHMVNYVPLLTYVGRADKRSDICGEKLCETFVANILSTLDKTVNIKFSFSMLAPIVNKNWVPYYGFFCEFNINLSKSQIEQVENYIEDQLCKNYHYNNCRKLNQLKKMKIYKVTNAIKIYEEVITSKDKKKIIGGIKIAYLDSYPYWLDEFSKRNVLL
ncbi:MAG: GH3 auxin-responsive promoter family protein [Oligoflexia bacterium]|nr:GH3 auxin-responsive promoter family protein [Oligoflexia bacterium]